MFLEFYVTRMQAVDIFIMKLYTILRNLLLVGLKMVINKTKLGKQIIFAQIFHL